MKFTIGKVDKDCVACCGHPISAGEMVLAFTHNQENGHVCQRSVCSRLFIEADAKLDRHEKAGEHPSLREDAEVAAFRAVVEKREEWNGVDDNAKRREAFAYEERFAQPHIVANSIEELRKAKRLRDKHHQHERTPAFHAAIAWAHTVVRA